MDTYEFILYIHRSNNALIYIEESVLIDLYILPAEC